MKISERNRIRLLIAAGIAGLALISSAGVTTRIQGISEETDSAASAQPGCVIGGKPAANNNDPLVKLLRSGGVCPANVFDLRSRILASGAKIRTTFVANRGFHNTAQGSLSLFEIVTGRISSLDVEVGDGEFFFGHFTARAGAKLIANQQPRGLMIELIVWDPVKQFFNFYELIGDGQRSQWFYRGDSADILADVELLHRQPDPKNPKFGTSLRCSGCHIAGGPILKELAAPHNDWWMRDRRLPLGGLRPDAAISAILNGLVDAEELASGVRAGLLKLAESEKFQQTLGARTLQERLRPLFCPVELNLESDPKPFDDRALELDVPTAFFANLLLAQGEVRINRAHYDAALESLKSSLPETNRRDADHGWLTPVKALSDTMAIESLVRQGLIDPEFVADVLAVDLTNPLFSPSRCELLRLVPAKADADWREKFKASLKAAAPANPAARELSDNLTNPQRDARFHHARAARFLDQCRKQLQTPRATTDLLRLLAQRRAEVFENEISKNRLGQILEPGFRIIFPRVNPPVEPKTFRLTEDCKVVLQ